MNIYLVWKIFQTPPGKSEARVNLPDKETLRQEILNTQRALAAHKAAKGKDL